MNNILSWRFLQWLLSLPLAGALAHPAVAKPVPRKYPLNQFSVAGLAYYDVQQVIQRLHPVEELYLVAESQVNITLTDFLLLTGNGYQYD